MSDISQSNPIITDLKITKENKTDFDFETQEKKDVFYSKRILRFFVLFLVIVVLVYVLIILGIHLWHNENL